MKLFTIICCSTLMVFFSVACSGASQEATSPTEIVEDLVEPSAIETAQVPESPPPDYPTPLPFTTADYEGWWTYTNPAYGFSLLLPEDWVVDETTTADALLNGHLIIFQPRNNTDKINIRVTFREIGDDVLLWPSGVGSGEFISSGTLDVCGQAARRVLFICPTGQVESIWYHSPEENESNLQIGNLEFGFILTFTGDVYCQEGYSLDGKTQRVGEMIIASLDVP
jgi:hypothetical protein